MSQFTFKPHEHLAHLVSYTRTCMNSREKELTNIWQTWPDVLSQASYSRGVCGESPPLSLPSFPSLRATSPISTQPCWLCVAAATPQSKHSSLAGRNHDKLFLTTMLSVRLIQLLDTEHVVIYKVHTQEPSPVIKHTYIQTHTLIHILYTHTYLFTHSCIANAGCK